MQPGRPQILIIEDHSDIVEIVTYHLEKEGFSVTPAGTGKDGMAKIASTKPDLVLLDLMLPDISGLEICKTLRSNSATQRLPIIMLTAKGTEEDIVKGLEMGADDYIPKPFGNQELVARIRSVIRRSDTKTEKFQFKDLSVDVARFQAKLKGEELQLTRAEFRLLQAVIANQGRVFTRDQLVDKITGGDVMIVDRNIDVHVSSLRKKLGPYGEYIVTVRGVGYRFAE